ncbi:terminase-like family protein [Clostridium sporogenes]|uniref:terminase large subunit domain-containing protein n=1 Tax=Clostridium botulinum TaxID=1491 RepID=UPI0007179B8C|nr:terminase large subunit [Clostridium botulinum]KRU24413.1 terminase-like family protein [Clostridium sporogenes]KRU25665.1 terminase-like family protein [Clostridium sporogenes]KRU30710.1 terminase-like family protein [Clostridium sporogenes]KRU50190.1 terminase-like family protein [Clostridium sporogenes]MBZ1331198.1 terminase [Clostridium botulinum]
MAISKENAKKLKYLFEDGHEKDFIRAFIKIVNKDTKTVPFILTKEQETFVEGLEKFNIVLKSRQLGLSVVTVALSIKQVIVNPNSCCLLVSHDQKSCNAIFDKLKQQFNSLPNFIKPEQMANNRQEIKLKNGSKITCVCAGNKDVGRGDTLHLVHLSEFAFWKMPKKQLNSITQALAPDGKLIIESTANGLNYFHDLYFQAKNNENSYKAFFFNWINGSSLFKKDYENSVEIYKSRNNNKILTENECDDEEKELVKIGATMEQLMWRRLKVASTGLEAFHQEYPSTDTEAFISTGNSVFNNKKITEIERSIISNKTKYIKKENILDLPSSLKNLYGRSFFIYQIPQAGKRYYIGADLSEGVGQDYSVIEVLDKDGEQVAEFYNNKIKPYKMSEIINCIGKYYNYALLCVEKASGGHSVIERLRYDLSYMNMVKYKSYDDFQKLIWNVGFDTNSKTKSIIINDFVEMFEKNQLKINSERLLQEMQVFVSENGKMGAISGSHDDSVMSMALAIVSIKYGFWYV